MTNDGKRVAQVLLFRGIDKPLSYVIPQRLSGEIVEGSMVRVPLRGGVANAIVIGTLALSEFDGGGKIRLKPLYSTVQSERVLTPDLIGLSYWMRDYYACGMQQVFESMIPGVVREGKGALEVREISMPHSLSNAEIEKIARRAPQQAKICRFLSEYSEPILRPALLKMADASASALDALIKKGVLMQTELEADRPAFDDELSNAEMISSAPPALNPEQESALNDILGDLDSEKFSARLLYGVTGSGKTEVYMRAMKKVLDAGGSCIFLVPEISLTPQTVGRLKSRLGDCGLVVWHSGLSNGQRLDAWRKLARGQARVVVGARSCIFAPLENLRLVIVDEEHDTAYKQDKAPRYNGRDVAVLRAKICGCPCILGSATPSLETLYNAKTGKYSVSRIRKRVDGRRMPKVFIADMKHEKPGAVISGMLAQKIGDKLDKSEQCILFLNRRGYSKLFECPDCGHVEECPHCSVSMTWHKRDGLVKCHLCGYTAKAPRFCRKCGSDQAKWKGHGTQKLEDIISSMYPRARVGRMDRDSMKRRDNYRRILGDFRAGKLDILIGTQMIAKGLDFPRVTLVGIIDADISLHMQDFRAAEKTYQLIVQVAGRAGRGDGAGEVVIQTREPESAPIQYAKKDDMEAFLQEELSAREEYSYPPTTRLIRHIFRSRNGEKLALYLEEWARRAEDSFGELCQIRGPSPAPIEKSEDYYRWHIWYFCRAVRPTVEKILSLRKDFKLGDDIEDAIDVDPMSMA